MKQIKVGTVFNKKVLKKTSKISFLTAIKISCLPRLLFLYCSNRRCFLSYRTDCGRYIYCHSVCL